MHSLRLERLLTIRENCALGQLVDGGDVVCKTLELPWRENRLNVSRIPGGRYQVQPYGSHHNGDCYRFLDWQTKPRSGILIHVANVANELEGCIAVGEDFGMIRGRPAVTESLRAMERLRGLYKDTFNLLIIDDE